MSANIVEGVINSWSLVKYLTEKEALVVFQWDQKIKSWTFTYEEKIPHEDFKGMHNLIVNKIHDRVLSKDIVDTGITIRNKRTDSKKLFRILNITHLYPGLFEGEEDAAENLGKCEECKDKKFVQLLGFYSPCSKCHPSHSNIRMTRQEICEFIEDDISD